MCKEDWIPAKIPPAQDGLYLTTATLFDRADQYRSLYLCEFKDGIWQPELIGITILAWMPSPPLYGGD